MHIHTLFMSLPSAIQSHELTFYDQNGHSPFLLILDAWVTMKLAKLSPELNCYLERREPTVFILLCELWF